MRERDKVRRTRDKTMELLSQMWSLLGLLTVLQNVLPSQLLSLLHSLYDSLAYLLTPYAHLDVPEFNGFCGVDVNDLYRHVHLYLTSLQNPVPSSTAAAPACRRLTLSRSAQSPRISFAVAANQTIDDHFLGHRLSWTHHVDTVQDSPEEKRGFSLRLPKRHRHALLSPYLEYVTSRAEEYARVSRQRRLFTNNRHAAAASYDSSGWVSVPFRHPSTFETLALEPELKDKIMEDLASFAGGGEFYRRVGRAWKRGYLLYGPPGSGKSSLIAAMSNLLHYDVYDLELTKVSDNSELRALLIQTTSRSIIVIEDIDCSLDLTADRLRRRRGSNDEHDDDEERGGRVTLSGLLNFTDGLWSCCGEERIIVFTTNRRDGVDAALVRRGRMDMHVRLGHCGAHAFRALAANYLCEAALASHAGLVETVESCIKTGAAMTPAEIAEILLRNRRDPEGALRAVISAMQGVISGREAAAAEVWEKGEEEEFPPPPGSPESGAFESPERKWESSASFPIAIAKEGGRKRKEKMAKLLVRLKSLTKSDSGRRGI